MFVHTTYATYICSFVQFTCTSLWYKQNRKCLLKPCNPQGLVWRPQNDNTGNLVFVKYIFTVLYVTLSFYWTWYTRSIFLKLDRFYSYLINNTHFMWWAREVFLKLPCQTYVVFFCWGVHFQMYFKNFITRKLHIFH